MANEIELSIPIHIEPDLTKLVKSTARKHEEVGTGANIPAKSTCYKVSWRYDGHLYSGYMTISNYQKLTD